MYMSASGMGAIGGMHQMHQRLGYPRTNNQRPPNVNVGPPDGLGNSIASRGNQQEWRHVLMQQQGFQMRPQFNQQGHQGKCQEKERETEKKGESFCCRLSSTKYDHNVPPVGFSLASQTLLREVVSSADAFCSVFWTLWLLETYTGNVFEKFIECIKG